MGGGKCQTLDGNDPAHQYHHGAGDDACEEICNSRSDCYGYSVSNHANCLIWLQSDITGGGNAWGGAHCHIKSTSNDNGAPRCNDGYYDITGGNAYYWACGRDCPGGANWADFHCNCACAPLGTEMELFSTSGNGCEVRENCVSSRNYPNQHGNNENCEVTLNEDVRLTVSSDFELETCCDNLVVRGVDVEGSSSVPLSMNAGESFTWSTDGSVTRMGWEICFDINDMAVSTLFTMGGDCDIQGDCVSSSNYPNEHGHSESCDITLLQDVHVTVGSTFDLETCCDHLMIRGEDVESPDAVPDRMNMNERFTWASDFSVARNGWQLCFQVQDTTNSQYFEMRGDCDVQGDCVSSSNYPAEHGNHEACTISVLEDASVTAGNPFNVEECCDHLLINGVDVESAGAVPSSVSAGHTISWETDGSVTEPGWQLCFGPPGSGGSSTTFFTMEGDCEVQGDCVSTANYPGQHGNRESCSITMLRDAAVSPDQVFAVETCCDHLMLGDLDIESYAQVPAQVSSGQVFSWSTDSSVTREGWQLCFSETDGSDGSGTSLFFTVSGDCDVQNDCVSSSNYPSPHGNHESCSVTMLQSANVAVDSNFDVETCCDHLLIRGNDIERATDAPTSLSEGETFTWTTDGSVASNGWQLCFSDSSGEGSSEFFTMTGQCDVQGDCVSSSNYPGVHGNNEQCSVRMLQMANVAVGGSFQVESCCDDLVIRGIDVIEAVQVPDTLHADETFTWSTDGSVTNSGWQLCFSNNGYFSVDGDCDTRNNCVSSKNYPNEHGNHESCTVTMLMEADVFVAALNVETCCDHLMIRGVDAESTDQVPGRLSEGETFSWTTDGSVTRGGWELCFSPPTIVDPSVDGDFFTMTGDCDIQGDCVSSANWPSAHNNNEQCSITMNRNAQVSVGQTFNLETCCDQLMIRGVDVEASGSVPSSLSAGETFTWSTDGSVTREGWQLCFADSMGGDYFTVSGDGCDVQGDCVSSRNYPDQHGNRESCTVTVLREARIQPTNTFSVETCCDNLIINGNDIEEYTALSSIGTLSANDEITWTTDGSVVREGWQICFSDDDGGRSDYFEMTGDCEVQGDCVSSANYPGQHGNNEQCSVTMLQNARVTPGAAFALETCCDHLMIQGVDVELQSDVPSSLPANSVFSWSTDSSVTREGWQLCFSPDGGSDYFEVEGDCDVRDDCVSSRGYPASHGNSETCSVRMLMDARVTVNDEFNVETCCDDLVILGVDVHTVEQVPTRLESGDFITWTTDSSVTLGGWELCFSEPGGNTGDFFQMSGDCDVVGDCVQSRGYPQNHGNEEACSVNMLRDAAVTVGDTFDLETCCDHLMIRGVDVEVEDQVPPVLLADETFSWTTDYSVTLGGWQLCFSEVSGGDIPCEAHSDCPTDLPFCYERMCAPCDECHFCNDGVDGTCGSCGAGYPTLEDGPCETDESRYFRVSGDCDVQNNCVSSLNYPSQHGNNEQCTVTMLMDASMTPGNSFELETCCDHLMIQGVDVESSNAVPDVIRQGEEFTWSTDSSVTRTGWEICFSPLGSSDFFTMTGDCDIQDNCVSSGNYPDRHENNEYCEITMARDAYLQPHDVFELETCCDHLYIRDQDVESSADVPERLRAGEVFTWSSDLSVTSFGWQICFYDSEPPSTTTFVETTHDPTLDCDYIDAVLTFNDGSSTHATGYAEFGDWSQVIEAPAVIADPFTACDPITNDLSGQVAVVQRSLAAGGCYFSTKARNAQNAGAVAVIILNNGRVDLDTLTCGDASCDDITIPVLFVYNEHAEDFETAIRNDPGHVVHLGCPTYDPCLSAEWCDPSDAQYCADWAQRGECDINPAYMLECCKEECGVCSEWFHVTGDCEYHENCVSSMNYPNEHGILEDCQIVMARDAYLQPHSDFEVETCCDHLIIRDQDVESAGQVPAQLNAGETINWSTDHSVNRMGWEICFFEDEPPETTSDPNPDPLCTVRGDNCAGCTEQSWDGVNYWPVNVGDCTDERGDGVCMWNGAVCRGREGSALYTMTGDCDTQGDCVSSSNYPELHGSNEECTITIDRDVRVVAETYFEVETCCDHLMIRDIDVEHPNDVPASLSQGEVISWNTDFSVSRPGWQLCFYDDSSTSDYFVMEGDGCDVQGDCVSSLNWPNSHGNNEACEIRVITDARVTPGNTFQLETGFDRLIINEEDISMSADIPTLLNTGSRINWLSDGSVTMSGWQLCFSEPDGSPQDFFSMVGDCDVQGDCVSSKNFPDPHGNSESCSVTMLQDAVVNSHSVFELETCCDHLMIQGQDIEYSRDIPAFLPEGEVFSWTTDSSVARQGWQLCFSTESGGLFTMTGQCEVQGDCVSSMNYPEPHGSNDECSVTILQNVNARTGSEWDLEPNFDYLMIRGQQVFTPEMVPDSFPTGETFSWHADGSVNHNGWQLCFTPDDTDGSSWFYIGGNGCQVAPGASNCVESNNYPNAHGNNEDCSVTMLRDASVRVGNTFDLETCCDHLMIREVDVESTGAVPAYLSEGEMFTWTTDGSVTSNGWQLCFGDDTTIEPTDIPTCAINVDLGRTVTMTSVTINGACDNQITIYQGQQVAIHMEYENSEDSCPGCIEQIYVGIEGTPLDCIYNGNPSGHHSDDHALEFTDLPPGTYVIVATATWQYNCLDDVTTGSQIAVITVLGNPTDRDLFTMDGDCDVQGNCVSSRNYPNQHGNNEECSIQILRDAYVSVGGTFGLETCCDHLHIDDIDVDASSAVPNMLSQGAEITWSTDVSVTQEGWQLCFSEDTSDSTYFRMEGDGCTVQGDCVSSLNYPNAHGNMESCTVTMLADAGVTSGAVFELEAGFDHLMIDDVSIQSSNQLPGMLSEGEIFTWSSDGSVTNAGWQLCFTEPGGGRSDFFTMEGDCDVQGDCVSSNNYPSAHGNSESCSVTMLQNANVVAGNTFELETCCDHLMIQGIDVESPDRLPDTLLSGETFSWTTDSSVTTNGWQLCFTSTGSRFFSATEPCETRGDCVSSSNYPNSHGHNEACSITMLEDATLTASSIFEVESCCDDLVIRGQDVTDPANLPTQLSAGEVFTWRSDGSVAEAGWEFCFGPVGTGRFFRVNGDCDVQDNCVSSKNYPEAHGHEEYCSVTMLQNAAVIVSDAFDIELCCDWLMIRGTRVESASEVPSMLEAGQVFSWNTDGSVSSTGWQVCFEEEHHSTYGMIEEGQCTAHAGLGAATQELCQEVADVAGLEMRIPSLGLRLPNGCSLSSGTYFFNQRGTVDCSPATPCVCATVGDWGHHCDANDAVVIFDDGHEIHMTSHAMFGPWYQVIDARARYALPSQACTELTLDMTGLIAVIDRGECFFSVKIRNAQNAGAIAVIILNNQPEDVGAMSCGDDCSDITIPAVFIPNESVDIFRDTVVSDPDHIWHIGCNPNVPDDWLFDMTGDCETSVHSGFQCVSSRGYPGQEYNHDEMCTITMREHAYVIMNSDFDIEECCDHLNIGDIMVNSPSDVPDSLNAGQEITWTSDASVSHLGWEMCFSLNENIGGTGCTMSRNNIYPTGTDCGDYEVSTYPYDDPTEDDVWEYCSRRCLQSPSCIGVESDIAPPGFTNGCILIFNDNVGSCFVGDFFFYPKTCLNTDSAFFDYDGDCDVQGDCISSLNYPGAHGTNEECTITMLRDANVVPGAVFSVETCCDHLLIDGVDTETSDGVPSRVNAGSTLQWTTDGSVQYDGWQLCFSDPDSSVSDRFTMTGDCDVQEGGQCVSSNNFPQNHGNDEACTITMLQDSSIEVHEVFELEANYDDLVIVGTAVYDSHQVPASIDAGQIIEWSTDGSVTNPGWQICFDDPVPSEFFSVSGDGCDVKNHCVSSLNYPAVHGNNEACEITVLRDADTTVSSTFSLETCCDHLMINGADTESSELVPTGMSAGDTITWSTDGSVTREGWEICFSPATTSSNWFTIDGSGCVPDGNCVQSHNYPEPHGNNEQCTVNIAQEAFLSVGSVFELEQGFDVLAIGGTDVRNEADVPLRVTTGETMTWRTDGSVTRAGWRICFSDEPVGTNRFIMEGDCDVEGNCVSSNNYPGFHGNNEECSVTMLQDSSVTAGSVFSLETCCDHLDVAGIDVDYSTQVPSHVSAGDTITWATDFSEAKEGWKLCFGEADSSQTLFSVSGDCDVQNDCVSSRNYPFNHGDDERCEITLNDDVFVTPGDVFSLETCCDHLMFNGILATTFDAVPESMFARDEITWDTDSSVNNQGWQLCFRAQDSVGGDRFSMIGDCDVQGDCVSSANYPEEHGNNEACSITVLQDSTLTPGDIFEVETCCDELSIHGVDTEGSHEVPASISAGQTIEWSTDFSVTSAGWQICFSDGPNGDFVSISHDSDAGNLGCELVNNCVQTINYPELHGNNENCEVTVLRDAELVVNTDFSVETCCDNLLIRNVDVENQDQVPNSLNAGETFTWSTDSSVARMGWQICFQEPGDGSFFSIDGDGCEVEGDCVQTNNYPDIHGNNEQCTVNVLRDSFLHPEEAFEVETCCDNLLIGGFDVESADDIPPRLSSGEIMEWSSDFSVESLGWRICFSDEPQGTSRFRMEGGCEVVDNCVSSSNYPRAHENNEECEIFVLQDSDISFGDTFDLESCCDHLMIGGVDIESESQYPTSLMEGDSFTWTSDFSVTSGGWQICFHEFSGQGGDFFTVSGDCDVQNDCVSSNNYPREHGNDESCSVNVLRDATLSAGTTFAVEACCDHLMIGGVDVEFSEDVPRNISAGTRFEWNTDFSVANEGWQICFSEAGPGTSDRFTVTGDCQVRDDCVSSNNYPNAHGNEESCEIEALMDSSLQPSAVFNVETCCDHLMINGIDVEGSHMVPERINAGDKFTWTTDYSVAREGWEICFGEPIDGSWFRMTGDCDVQDNCVMSNGYPGEHGHNENCEVEMLRSGTISSSAVEVETCCDHLMIGGVDVEGTNELPQSLSVGDRFSWSTDGSVANSGWQLCFEDMITDGFFSISGDGCEMNAGGDCVQSLNYPDVHGNNEACEVTILRNAFLSAGGPFSVETCCDNLYIGGVDVEDATMIPGRVNAGEQFSWSTDFSVFESGWQVCFSDTDRGSDRFTMTGDCDVQGDCVSSNNWPQTHGNNEACTVTLLQDSSLDVHDTFRLETCCDHLMIRDVDTESSNAVPESLRAGEQIQWTTDGSVTSEGWQICFGEYVEPTNCGVMYDTTEEFCMPGDSQVSVAEASVCAEELCTSGTIETWDIVLLSDGFMNGRGYGCQVVGEPTTVVTSHKLCAPSTQSSNLFRVTGDDCEVENDCVRSSGYPSAPHDHNEECTIQILADVHLTPGLAFEVETCCDHLIITHLGNDENIKDRSQFEDYSTLSNGDQITWTSDVSVAFAGWEMCFSEFTEVTFISVDRGNCADADYSHASEAQCTQISREMGYGDTLIQEYESDPTSILHPYGCYFSEEQNSYVYNRDHHDLQDDRCGLSGISCLCVVGTCTVVDAVVVYDEGNTVQQTSHAAFGRWYEVVEAHAVRAVPFDACSEIQNSDEMNGQIAVIMRGDCFFSVKVRNAQNAGARAVIVMQNDPSPDATVGTMACGDDCDDIVIPAVFLNTFDDAAFFDMVDDPNHMFTIGCQANHNQPSLYTMEGDCGISGNCISSPGFPSEHGDNQECVVEVHQDVHMHWDERFEIETCCDHLYVDDVDVDALGVAPRTMSAGRQIRWNSDFSVSYVGWRVCLTTEPSSDYFAVSGTGCDVQNDCVSSRNYPEPHGATESCIVEVLQGGYVALSSQFSVEVGWDRLIIDGIDFTSGEDIPNRLEAGSHISWSTDDSVHLTGWQVCFSDEPGASTPAPTGTTVEPTRDASDYFTVQGPCPTRDGRCVSSTNYPDGYGNNEQCVITVSQDAFVALSSPFFIEEGSSFFGDYDTLDVYQSGSSDIRIYGRSDLPSILTRGSTIEWQTDGSISEAGWEICFSTEEPTTRPHNDYFMMLGDCDIQETTRGPCVSSANWPNDHENNENCEVVVIADAAIDLHTNTEIEADYDFLTLQPASNPTNVIHYHDFPTQVSPGDEIHWESDHSIVNNGWQICFSAPTGTTTMTTTDASHSLFNMIGDCGIQAPNCVSSGNYPAAHGDNEQCVVTVLQDVQLSAGEEFIIEEGYDELIVHDELVNARNQLPEFLSRGDTILWSSDESVTMAGWQICMTSDFVTTTSPPYTHTNEKFGVMGNCPPERNARGQYCVSSTGYPNAHGAVESCSIVSFGQSMLYLADTFFVEEGHDTLTIAEYPITNDNYDDEGMWPLIIEEGETIEWQTDELGQFAGWKVCFDDVRVPDYEEHNEGVCRENYNMHQCEAIANDVGAFFQTEVDENYPAGCYWHHDWVIYYNYAAEGVQCSDYSWCLCPAGATDCLATSIEIVVETDRHANEISWTIPETYCTSPDEEYPALSRVRSSCCFENDGTYHVYCSDVYGDGWHNNVIKIGGVPFCYGGDWEYETHQAFDVQDGKVTRHVECDNSAIDVAFHVQLNAADLHWEIQGGDHCSSQFEEYENMKTYERECCLADGNYVIVCENTEMHMGWSGAHIDIGGVTFCNDFTTGSLVFHRFEISNGQVTSLADTTLAPAGCLPMESQVETVLETGNYGNEVSWDIRSVNVNSGNIGGFVCGSLEDTEYASSQTVSEYCCIEDGVYELQCHDSHGDGWVGDTAMITIGGTLFCQYFTRNYLDSHRFSVSNGVVTEIPHTVVCDQENTAQTLTVVTTDMAMMTSWAVMDSSGDTVCAPMYESRAYPDNTQTIETCCLPDGDYTVECTVSQIALFLGPGGWNGGYLEMGGVTLCADFDSGDSMQDTFLIERGQVMSATLPPTFEPTCGPGKHSIEVRLDTRVWGNEMQWEILQPNCMSEGTLSDFSTFVSHCCLEPGNYVLQCQDTFGDGWHNNTIVVGGREYCRSFLDGYIEEHRITVRDDGEIAPTLPECSNDEELYEVVLHTASFGNEISWYVHNNCQNYIQYDAHATYSQYCCIPPGSTLRCQARGYGWHGAYITFNGASFCEDFDTGSSVSVTLDDNTLATTAAVTTISPCDFGYDGPDCQLQVQALRSTMSFNKMTEEQFYNAREELLQGAADLLAAIGITRRDVEFGEINVQTRRRRLSFLEVPLFTEIKPGNSKEQTKAAIEDAAFKSGMENVLKNIPGLDGVSMVAIDVSDVPISTAWALTIDFTGMLGEDILKRKDAIMSRTASHLNAISYTYRASVAGLMTTSTTRIRFDLGGDTDEMSSLIDSCEEIEALEGKLTSLTDLEDIKITSVTTPMAVLDVKSECPDAGTKNNDSGGDDDDESFMEANGIYILITCLVIMILMVCGIAFLCVQKNEKITREVVYVNSQATNLELESFDHVPSKRFAGEITGGGANSLRTVQTIHPVQGTPLKRTPAPNVVPKHRSNLNSQYQTINTDYTPATGLYGDITPMGPDGFDSVVRSTNQEGSTINQQKIQSLSSPALSNGLSSNGLSMTSDHTASKSPPPVGGVMSLSSTDTLPQGGAVAPDDDFEGDIITM